MLKIKGIYDGTNVVLLESIALPPDTHVEVLIPEMDNESERDYWRRLIELGLIRHARPVSAASPPPTPIVNTGTLVSQTIIDERR